MDEIRLNKYLSEMGICSRREADRMIEDKRVLVNGKPAVFGMKISREDRICIDGKLIPANRPEKMVIALYKPRGYVCTTDRQWGDPLLEDLIDLPQRLFSIGRLDKESEGLILMTNDGDLAQKISRSENGHEKEYLVTVDREIVQKDLDCLGKGMYLKELNRMTKPCTVSRTGKRQFRIILTQGMNRQIRRMCKALGYRVEKLKRVRVMNITLGDLEPGQYRILGSRQTAELEKMVRHDKGSRRAGEKNES